MSTKPSADPIQFPATPVSRLRPPNCPACGNFVRPDIVWFGESLPEHAWGRAEAAMTRADVVVIVGTSGVVQPAASLPVLAYQRGTPILEISPAPTELTRLSSVYWPATAATALPRLVELIQAGNGKNNALHGR